MKNGPYLSACVTISFKCIKDLRFQQPENLRQSEGRRFSTSIRIGSEFSEEELNRQGKKSEVKEGM